ncbi:MAG: TIGR04219 family outer membrane beta-barrel protein [Aquificae bacterium]|nr:TIGR04219 family outer membrane beta-barrel protein [Aquificota bacterium]
MVKRALLLTVAGTLASVALELEVGGGPQREEFRGWVSYKGEAVDVKRDLALQDKTKYFVYLELRHSAKLGFIPLPDLRVEYLRMNTYGRGVVSRTFTFGDITVNANEPISTELRFHQLDLTFHYSPLKTEFLRGSWGFGTKVVDFKVKVRRENTGEEESESAVVPLPYLYAKAAGEVRFVHAFGEIKGLGVDGKNYFYDWRVGAGLHYDVKENLRISLDGGYRYQRYRIDDVSDVSADVRAKGAFGALSLRLSF